MSHITAGDLHAHIDGALVGIDAAAAERVAAHLRTCADCRVLAEDATALRHRSTALLDAALGQPAAPPPFSDIVVRAGEVSEGGAASAGSPQPSRPAWRGYAWAASISVALGAGWMANAMLRGSEGFSSTPEIAATARRQIDDVTATDALLGDRAVRARANEAAEPADQEADPAANSSRDRRAGDLAEGQPGRAGPATAGRADEAAPPPNETLAFRETRVEEQVAADAPRQARAMGIEREPIDEKPIAEGNLQNRDVARKAQVQAKSEVVGMEDVPAAFADADLADLTWRAAERAEASAWVGTELLVVPDLKILEYALAAGDGRRLTRVRQGLPGGETLELVQIGADPTAEADAMSEHARPASPLSERSESAARRLEGVAKLPETQRARGTLSFVWAEVGGIRVRAFAPVAPDSLRSLLSRIR